MESQNHLIDAVDSECIDEDTRIRYHALAEVALQEVTGLMEYLQSPEALRNARRARERRIASREQRKANRELESNKEPANKEPANKEPRNTEPGTEPEPEHEPRSENPEA